MMMATTSVTEAISGHGNDRTSEMLIRMILFGILNHLQCRRLVDLFVETFVHSRTFRK